MANLNHGNRVKAAEKKLAGPRLKKQLQDDVDRLKTLSNDEVLAIHGAITEAEWPLIVYYREKAVEWGIK